MITQSPTEFQCTIVTSLFDIAIQGILGVGCFASLLLKRYCETPRRRWLVFLLDISKQCCGFALCHVCNVLQSQWVQDKSVSPCVWYSAGITHVLFAHHRPGRRIHSADESPQVLRERVLRLDAARRRRLLAVPAGMPASHVCVGTRPHLRRAYSPVCQDLPCLHDRPHGTRTQVYATLRRWAPQTHATLESGDYGTPIVWCGSRITALQLVIRSCACKDCRWNRPCAPGTVHRARHIC